MTQLPVDLFIQLADYVPVTEAEGPGRRFAIWFQGCPLRCPGCCNPQMLPFQGGRVVSVEQLFAEVLAAARQQGIEGVTLLGGEPVAQAPAAAALASGVQDRGLTVMLFSGCTLDELQRMSDPAVAQLLGHCDLLVDGPYLRELPETQRRWIGSANQRVHFLTPRYRADDPCWRLPNTLEIRLEGQELLVNGFPAPAAAAVWQRPQTLPALIVAVLLVAVSGLAPAASPVPPRLVKYHHPGRCPMTQTTTVPVVEVLVPVAKMGKGEREYRAFLRLLPQLLVSHRGQYVAVHEGQVVDFDTDDIALIQRVHARFGYVPICVGLVTDPPPLLHIPHYREYRSADAI